MIDDGAADPTGADALRLYQWMTDPAKCPGWRTTGRTILNAGPACVRDRHKRDAALDMLAAAGLAERGEAGKWYALDPTEAATDADKQGADHAAR